MFEHDPIEFKEVETTTMKGGRYYGTPKGWYPSVTTVLGILSKKGIAEWRRRVGDAEADRISTQAARRGTNVHQMCEDYVDNNLDKSLFLPHERAMFNSIKKVLDKRVGKVRAQECALYSDYLGIAGRVDCIAEFDGKLSVIDYKTAGKLKKKQYIGNYFQQASAYCVMFEEMTGIPIDQIVIVIGVENEDEAQVFVEKRDNWIFKMIDTIKLYKDSIS
jgi:CRISPR/Cas system-associated exonuclease Cas4 (RecB family)